MITRLALTVAFVALMGLTATAGTMTWVCSVIEDGKPQVIKYTVDKNNVLVSDPITRLANEYGTPGQAYIKLKVVEDNAKGLIAVGDGIPMDPGEASNYSARVLMINKHTGAMSYLWLSTLNEPVATKGTCTN
jgi:hypothetical protein